MIGASILSVALGGRFHHPSHCTNEEAKAQVTCCPGSQGQVEMDLPHTAGVSGPPHHETIWGLTISLVKVCFFQYHQAINSVLTLSTWRKHQLPRDKGSVQDCPSPTEAANHKCRLLPVLLSNQLEIGGSPHPLLRFG